MTLITRPWRQRRSLTRMRGRGRGGGNGGRGYQRPPKPHSYGIVPWVKVNHQWFFLTQYGYSAAQYDSKIDPLRGRQEPNETPWQCAARECKEESGLSPCELHLLQYKATTECCLLRLTVFSLSISIVYHSGLARLHYGNQFRPKKRASLQSRSQWRRRTFPHPNHSSKSLQLSRGRFDATV